MAISEPVGAALDDADAMWWKAALSVVVQGDGRTVTVRRGDLLIANRLSSTQAVMNLSNDPWTHAALVGEVDGELVAIELGPRGCGARSITDFVAAYRFVGVAQPAMHDGCIDAVAATAELHLAMRDIAYSWDACRVLESVALLRSAAPARAEPLVVRFATGWARRLLRRMPPSAFTCSGFVDLCLSAACSGCRPAPMWPRRERIAIWRGLPSVVDLWRPRDLPGATDPLVVRAMSTPADLWLAECWHHRVVYRPDRTTLLFDMQTSERRPEMNPNP
jgi:hypothetical protein